MLPKKQEQESHPFLSFIEKYFTITGADNIDIQKALVMENLDLEDNVQAVLASKSNCDLIISNDKTFVEMGITVLNSDDFLKHSLS